MIKLHLLSLFDRDEYKNLIALAPYAEMEGIQIDLQGPQEEGIIVERPTEEEFRLKIPGFRSHSLHMDPGDWVYPLEHILNSPGTIQVAGTAEQVENAERRVREWEKGDFYRTRSPTLKERFNRWKRRFKL